MRNRQNVILLAEDFEDDAFLFKRVIEKNKVPCEVKVVSNGQDLLDYLFGHGRYGNRSAFPFPSLVILDIKMPQMDGLEALQLIRNNEKFSQLPVIIFTSSLEPQDVKRAYGSTANGYMVKPTDSQQYEEALLSLTKFWLEYNVRAD